MNNLIETKQSVLKLIKEAEAQFAGTGKALLDIEDYVAEYLTANGVIVPPCKVGDKFYRVVKRWQGKTVTWERKIDTFIVSIISYNGEEIILENDSEEYIWLSYIGKTVFLSREDAEKALKGVE